VPVNRSNRALVVVAHGTASDTGARACAGLVGDVRRRLAGVPVRLAFADVRGPTVADVVTPLLESLEVTVVPAFLASGYHVRSDVPAQLAELRAGERVRVTPPLGASAALITAVADRLRAAGWQPGDHVVLGAAGSRDPRARWDVLTAADRLGRRLGSPVRVGYLTGSEPRVADVVARSQGAGRRVAVASWLLAHGYFHSELSDCGGDLCTQPLIGHPGVTQAVLDQYREFSGTAVEAA
jgi:sirohydrochlorin ferrochelatase